MHAAIQTDDLSKDYGGVLALDGLSIEVLPGEIFGFLGPNGAGKSTTIRLLLDLIRPTSGRASILGFDCRRDSHKVRAVTGYLPGDLRLYSGMTGRETLALVAGLRGKRIDGHYVSRLASALDLNLDQHAGTLSKGNRQKLGVLVTMFDRPMVYLLDEPTSGLDPITQHVVWELLREETGRNATVFFSSHVMSEVEQVCQRVGILRNGKVVAVEPIATLKEHVLRRLDITFRRPVPADLFALEGVREVERHDTSVKLEVTGNLDEVVRAMARYPVIDLRTEQASLDEILLSFYIGGGQ
ncbi:MAG: ABC transporter ATP-binding protein [Thermomicrobiales bacterium]